MADDSITSAPVDAAETAAPTPNNSDSGSEHSKPKPWFKRLSLTTWIFIALILGGAGCSIPEVSLLNSIFKKQMVVTFVLCIFLVAVGTGFAFTLFSL